MSKLCIGVLDNNLAVTEVKKQIETLLRYYNLAVFYELKYEEPFLQSYNCNNYLIFSISDNDTFDNCEMFLLPDNAFYNGRRNFVSFDDRMKQLESIIKVILDKVPKLDLFIGESGTCFDEFDNYIVNIQEFLGISSSLNSINPPDLHFIITK